MSQIERELKTRIDGNEIQISRLRGQIPSLLAIRGGRVVIDAAKQAEADRLEEQEDILRKANARMTSAVEKVKEITQHDLDEPYTLASLLSLVKSYETEKVGLEQDKIRIDRQLGSHANHSPGFNTIDRKGIFHAAADPVGELKKRKREIENRTKELEKSIEKVTKVIAKIEPILQEALKS